MTMKSGSTTEVLAQQRWQMIAEAAYYRAESRGFAPGDPLTDWLESEAEIDAILATASGTEDIAGAERATALRRVETLLHDWEHRVEELMAAARQAGDKLQSEIHDQIAALGEQRAVARQKLESLRTASTEKWHEVREHSLQFFDGLQSSVDQIAARLKAGVKTKRSRQAQ